MNVETIREYCISKKAVTESFPFDEVTLVFKVANKMFALLSLDEDLSINLKCDPEKAIELREEFPFILPGYHMNKVHWNTVKINEGISERMLKELIDKSYDLIVLGLNKKQKLEFDKY